MQSTHPYPRTAPPTTAYHLSTRHGWVSLPDPTREFGGLTPVPYGYRANIWIGDARDIDEHTARQLAAALVGCAFYSVRGADREGLDAVCGALAFLISDVAPGRAV
ncbi:hypothetical protein [Streptomyces sp. NPDC001508]|uniref:hypothetical protein n=1 Tax=Streptomyces sp. NPDC001508 TaxID=3154656 RepID=UPI0033201289